MKKRMICLALSLIMTVGLLTGCGGKSGDGAGTGSAPENKDAKGNQEMTVGSMANDGQTSASEPILRGQAY